jgi:serine/threonine protein kinase
MSEIYDGRDRTLDRRVAVKVLRGKLVNEPAFRAQFRSEAEQAAALNHAAVVAVYDNGQWDTQYGPSPYLLMENLDGQTLRGVIKSQGAFDEQRAIEVLAEICTALDYLHRNGIVHGDITSGNVMVTNSSAVKVMDFCVGRAIWSAIPEGRCIEEIQAVTGSAHLSPEQARGEVADPRSDVYSAGCVFFEMLTGVPPFVGDSPAAGSYHRARSHPAAPSSLKTAISAEIDAIVLKALANDPRERYQSASEMRDAFPAWSKVAKRRLRASTKNVTSSGKKHHEPQANEKKSKPGNDYPRDAESPRWPSHDDPDVTSPLPARHKRQTEKRGMMPRGGYRPRRVSVVGDHVTEMLPLVVEGDEGDGGYQDEPAMLPHSRRPPYREPGTASREESLSNRYELGETLGYGGMSEVHRGHDARLGRDVAVKVLRADLAPDPTFQERFRREAQNAVALDHPAIVAVYDTGETQTEAGALPYIVMEYVDGRTLREIIKTEGPLPEQRACEIMADVCAALDFSHRNGIVHRDMKPGNVMLTRSGAVKVMDFGIARALTDGQSAVTQTAAVIGTAQYLSPEQARGEAVDARSDVYSAGCVLFEMLTGEPPFQGESPVAVAYQHVREDPKAPSEVNPAVSGQLDSIVLKALSKNPANRYQSAAEMRADVVRVLAGQRPSAPAVTPVPNSPTGPANRKRWWRKKSKP